MPNLNCLSALSIPMHISGDCILCDSYNVAEVNNGASLQRFCTTKLALLSSCQSMDRPLESLRDHVKLHLDRITSCLTKPNATTGQQSRPMNHIYHHEDWLYFGADHESISLVAAATGRWQPWARVSNFSVIMGIIVLSCMSPGYFAPMTLKLHSVVDSLQRARPSQFPVVVSILRFVPAPEI